jgi:hypothetical protein
MLELGEVWASSWALVSGPYRVGPGAFSAETFFFSFSASVSGQHAPGTTQPTNQRPVKRFYPPSSSSPTPILPMASEIEVLEDTTVSTSVAVVAFTAPAAAAEGAGAEVAEDESLKNDVYTAAAYGDLEKLQRLVEGEGRPVNGPDGGGYHALQWAALNNRVAAAQYILEVGLFRPCLRHAISVVDSFLCLLLVDLDWVGFGILRAEALYCLSSNYVYQKFRTVGCLLDNIS